MGGGLLEVSPIIIKWGTATIDIGQSQKLVTFDQPYTSIPTIVLTSTTTQGGGSVNVWVGAILASGFTIGTSFNGGYDVEVNWRAIL
tara:strand:- start:234 stop:494 length:261 start_codon:yes stop_codon:yes gene_type:complete